MNLMLAVSLLLLASWALWSTLKRLVGWLQTPVLRDDAEPPFGDRSMFRPPGWPWKVVVPVVLAMPLFVAAAVAVPLSAPAAQGDLLRSLGAVGLTLNAVGAVLLAASVTRLFYRVEGAHTAKAITWGFDKLEGAGTFGLVAGFLMQLAAAIYPWVALLA